MKLNNRNTRAIGLILLVISCFTFAAKKPVDRHVWSDTEIATLKSLWIGSLLPLPPDPSNKFADDPDAAKLGHQIFFDTRFSANGNIACVSCHLPEKAFTDGLGRAKGLGTTRRGAPTLIGASYSPWFFWDGRSDSQWSQAMGPLENHLEHGSSRSQIAHIIFDDLLYRKQYESIFGPMPDLSDRRRFPKNAGPINDKVAANNWKTMSVADQGAITRVFVNIAKVVTAYERLLKPGTAPFDTYIEAAMAGNKQTMQETLTPDAVAGLRVFIKKGICVSCHNGPLLTNHGFQNVGTPLVKGMKIDEGRYRGIQQAQKSEFNCLGKYSDAGKNDCAELRFAQMARDDTVGAFKVPTLRNITETAPYTHSGKYKTLTEVVAHYRNTPTAPIGFTELISTGLTRTDMKHLEAFLKTLSGKPDIAERWMTAPAH
jgi:cytochrome c peroxidase